MRLVEIPGNPAPPGAVLHELAAADGVTLRAAVWPSRAQAPRGTMVVCTGRTEFIEKYFEFIGEVLARGYAAVAIACYSDNVGSQDLNIALTQDRADDLKGER